ncbi:MAG: hypothetical protein E5V63_18395 [Mesorhizobium sp.]|nr:MAG: hypothetical protein E5V63_18395 [Mesorhizobium sp.]
MSANRITEAMDILAGLRADIDLLQIAVEEQDPYSEFYSELRTRLAGIHATAHRLAAALSQEPGVAEEKPVAWLRPRDIARLSETSPGAINAKIANKQFERWTIPVFAAPLSSEEKR